MPLDYLLARIIRRFMPRHLVRFLLRRGWIIKPGLETSDPHAAVQRYRTNLAERGISLENKRVLVFGYGGNFAVGIELRKSGAAHIVLCDPYALPDDMYNKSLLAEFEGAISLDKAGTVVPNPAFITVLGQDIRTLIPDDLAGLDIILSSSVYEHLDDAESITAALSVLTKPGGIHLHFIDLRDHFFKYPFEMLCYSQLVWRRWLNPTSNLNRLRLGDYHRIFEKHFRQTDICVLAQDKVGLERTRHRICPEFLSGDVDADSVTLIQVLAVK